MADYFLRKKDIVRLVRLIAVASYSAGKFQRSMPPTTQAQRYQALINEGEWLARIGSFFRTTPVINWHLCITGCDAAARGFEVRRTHTKSFTARRSSIGRSELLARRRNGGLLSSFGVGTSPF